MVSAIVCVDKNWGIGYKGNLLVSIPEDMSFFRDKTRGNIVIMGRKTYDSLPSKPLPYRTNIVITSKVDNYMTDENGTIFASMNFIKTLLNILPSKFPLDVYIIGGGHIYKELLPYCDNAYVTKINCAYKDVDTYFPNLEKEDNWEIAEVGDNKVYRGTGYKFCIYKKEM